jgi:hypothetical protein
MSDAAFDGIVHIVSPPVLRSEINNKHLAAANAIKDEQKEIKEKIRALNTKLNEKGVEEKRARASAINLATIDINEAMGNLTKNYAEIPDTSSGLSGMMIYARLK